MKFWNFFFLVIEESLVYLEYTQFNIVTAGVLCLVILWFGMLIFILFSILHVIGEQMFIF